MFTYFFILIMSNLLCTNVKKKKKLTLVPSIDASVTVVTSEQPTYA